MIILMVLLYFCCVNLTAAEKIPTNNPESFSKDELALRAGNIIRQRCFECHGPDKQKADLRLDQQKFLSQPLSSGSSLLHTDPEQSELYQRITSSDPDFRMPTNRDPLPVEEIEILKRWLEAGSPSYIDEVNNEESTFVDRWIAWGSSAQTISVPLLAALLFWLMLSRLARTKLMAGEDPSHGWRRIIHWLVQRPESFILLALAVGFWQEAHIAFRGEEKALAQINERVKLRELGSLIRPHHPPRLGGTYYRGNDERDPKLFNSGFYCTCIFEVYLTQGDRRLAWDDSVSEDAPLKIVVEIKRAPFATSKLLEDRRMNVAVLTEWNSYVDGQMANSANKKDVSFETAESGEHWIAEYGLKEPLVGPSHQQAGKLFIATSARSMTHYGISYTIIIDNGIISRESEIWMGAMYFTNDVIVPREGEIPLGEWFDFRPMPMIEGGNSDDPKLLGIDEHLDAEAKGKEPAKEK